MTDPAARFTLRQLSCFVAACEDGGIGAAAGRLHLAQATVSAAIADLERTLGVQLLVRGRRRAATPSPAGRELLAQAADVLAAAGRLDERSAALRGDVSGELPVGCLVTLAPAVAPAICRAFEGRWPRARVTLVPAHQAELLAHLRDGTIALAITYDLGLNAAVELRSRSRRRPPYALVAATHPRAGASVGRPRRAGGASRSCCSTCRSRATTSSASSARRASSPPSSRRVADPELVRSLVAWGYGYTLANARPVPARAVDGTPIAARSRCAAGRRRRGWAWPAAPASSRRAAPPRSPRRAPRSWPSAGSARDAARRDRGGVGGRPRRIGAQRQGRAPGRTAWPQLAPDEVPAAVAFLSGRLLQRQTGAGWAALRDLPPPSAEPSLDGARGGRGVRAHGRARGAGLGRGAGATSCTRSSRARPSRSSGCCADWSPASCARAPRRA